MSGNKMYPTSDQTQKSQSGVNLFNAFKRKKLGGCFLLLKVKSLRGVLCDITLQPEANPG